jgi:ABC-2 type transport system permease protein
MLFVQAGATVEGEAFTAGDVFGFMPTGAVGAYALSSISSLYGMAVVIFSGLFISTEFSQGTIRNALCVGVSRVKIYLSKLFVNASVLAICMIVSVIAFIASFTLMYGFGERDGFIINTITVFGMQLLYHLTYAGIGCLFAFLIPNIAFSVASGIIFVVLQGVLVEICSAFDVLNWIAPLIPQYYVTRLNDTFHNASFLINGAVVSVVFIAVTAFLGCILFRRQDIK